jgi:hypothetical protein
MDKKGFPTIYMIFKSYGTFLNCFLYVYGILKYFISILDTNFKNLEPSTMPKTSIYNGIHNYVYNRKWHKWLQDYLVEWKLSLGLLVVDVNTIINILELSFVTVVTYIM